MIPQQSRSRITLFRVLFSIVLGLGVCYLFLLLSSTSAMPPQNSLPQASVSSRVAFTKGASNLTPHVGEVFTFTLEFNTTGAETEPIHILMVDENPAPSYLQILSDMIKGGAIYIEAIDAVVWEGVLQPAGSLPQKVTFQVEVAGVPPSPLPPGYPVTNTAAIADLAKPGSLPEAEAEITIRLMSANRWIFLPFIGKRGTNPPPGLRGQR